MSERFVNGHAAMLDGIRRAIEGSVRSVGAALWREKGVQIEPKDVNFYDYDGTLVYSYTKKEFALLTALPANPMHEGLDAQGWNWTLAGAKAYVAKYGKCEIGQMYITEDGKTRLYIEIAETERLATTLSFTQTVANGCVVDWGDGNTETSETEGAATAINLDHTYAQAGKYVITLTVADGCQVMLGTSTAAMTADGALSHQNSLLHSKYLGGRALLRAVEIGANVNAIGTQALVFDNLMKYITIPASVTAVNAGAFSGCRKLTGAVIPGNVTAIGAFAFRACHLCNAIVLPEGLTTIGAYAFYGCTGLERTVVPEGVTALPNGVFSLCYTADSIVVPDGVTSFGFFTFNSCEALSSVNIPAGVTVIPSYCFRQCTALTDLTLPEGLTEIKEHAFMSVYGVRSLTIPASVTALGDFALFFCDGLEEIHMLSETPPTLATPSSIAAPVNIPDFKIYVPWSADHSVLNAYLEATNWAGKFALLVEEDAPEGAEETTGETTEEPQEPTNDPTDEQNGGEG